MADKKQTVKYGDVSQRVGVEVIRARGVDVEKLIGTARRSPRATSAAVRRAKRRIPEIR